MRLLGFDIKRSKKPGDFSTDVQLKPTDGQGPFTKFFSTYVPRQAEATFYEALREAIPVIDAAIWKLVALDGHLIVKGNNAQLVDEIQDWMDNVTVNDLQQGLQAFHQNLSNEVFEQGFGLGEFLPDKKRTDIIQLKVADSKTIKFSRTPNGLSIFQKTEDDQDYRLLKPNNLLYFSIHNESQNPHGTPIMRSMEFVGKVLATMHNSLLNVWERFGDPSYHVAYKASKGKSLGDTTLETRRKKLHDDFKAAIDNKRTGQSMDFVTAVDKDSDLVITVIGGDGQVLEVQQPARHVLEQIIAKTGLPAWMLGMHWSTTERLADKEVTMLQEDRATRHAAKLPLFTRLAKTLLLLRGRTWKKDDWWLEFAALNLHDIVAKAKARFLNLQGDYYIVQNAETQGIEVDPAMLSTGKYTKNKRRGTRDEGRGTRDICGCGHPHSFANKTKTWGLKELTRPWDWPELDKFEDDYEAELKYEWKELEGNLLTILKLPAEPNNLRLPDRTQATASARAAARKQGIPGMEEFTFTAEQRAMIMQALKDWIGIFEIDDPDSPVTWYYGQSYSLGLIQAASMIGEAQPLLNIINNSEVVTKLYQNGFDLVKSNAQYHINAILAEIDGQVLAGANPAHVAQVLKSKFEKVDAVWERLARSELAMAAERAKLDEWKKRKVKMIEFTPAPDACPICVALAGVYPISKVPLVVDDTHPRCRCSTRPAESEVG